eukprot:TRINITY_DN7807_c0_g1_i1.p1 TRINITY_DN7807_c0_g1~~TRINITY_DN7807_c0_g1_i1.p1  ORF type:complete len:244 (-),score=62.08 TRINITY_DN7807_c0_g1_i1:312-1043(-)
MQDSYVLNGSIFFLNADLRLCLEEKDEMEQTYKGEGILETYFSANSEMGTAISPLLLEKINKYDQKGSKASQLILLEEIQQQISVQINQLDISTLIKGAAAAAIYRKRSGGTGDLPDEAFRLLREKMDPYRPEWVMGKNGDCQVWTQMGEECFTLLETTIANVPLQTAINFNQYQYGQQTVDEMKVYKAREMLEEIGPMSRINYILLKKIVLSDEANGLDHVHLCQIPGGWILPESPLLRRTP